MITANAKGPPFDGSAPCPMCPPEIRNLHAVAHNLLTAWGDRPHKVLERIEELRRAVADVQVLADAHFADSMHSHGRLP